VGPAGSGKATTIGCMLFNYGAIDLLTMERFERGGVKTYDQAAKELTSLEVQPKFHTPKHHITLADISPSQADCAIIVLAADDLGHGISASEISRGVKKLIVLINKMDKIDWSEAQFQRICEGLSIDTEKYSAALVSQITLR